MIKHWQLKLSISLIILLPLLSGCGGSSGAAAVNTITVSGTITYTDYNVESGIGIDYSAPLNKPIRGASVTIENSRGQLFSSSTTDASGHYTLQAPENDNLNIVVYATLSNASQTINTWVIDNTNERTTHTLTARLDTGSENIQHNFNADSGWGGSRYSQPRVAAPFAILDVIYQAQQRILSVDPIAFFYPLAVNWSELNRPIDGDPALGEISGSHYQPTTGQIFLLGAEDINTDEYDDHVIAHEWIHYLEHSNSRSDSVGGSHNFGDILDPTIAFSEGLADALGAIVRNDSLILNSYGANQATVDEWDADQNSIANTLRHAEGIRFDGYYSESSVAEVIYDLYDSGPGDDDSIALGFKPIYDALMGGHGSTAAFTSIFSFLHYLKQDQPASAGAITTLALAENIHTGDEFEATADRFYNDVIPDGGVLSLDLDGVALQTRTTYGPITNDFFGHGNKLLNRLFFRFNVINAGCYTLKAIPASNSDDLAIYTTHIWGGFYDDFGIGATESQPFYLESGFHSYAIAGRGGVATFSTSVESTPSACV
ncbi:MAG: carboxypeptidase regulatory-like domain-containing protein [Thiotrichaceae bacterium]|nr:carboxypeptidase regulatory-like domain-containing protein [Thiotrichaceae bacterium]PCI12128.1 MAG: hypothetical protein COB71_10380 [Thiotrichales bacterium]